MDRPTHDSSTSSYDLKKNENKSSGSRICCSLEAFHADTKKRPP